MPTARGTFEVHDWAGESWHEADGIALGAASLRKTFTGDLTGASTVRIVTGTDGGAPMSYVGLETVDAELDGRSGTFVLQHASEPGDSTTVLTRVVPGSGRGDLASITGTLRIVHEPGSAPAYVLDCELA